MENMHVHAHHIHETGKRKLISLVWGVCACTYNTLGSWFSLFSVGSGVELRSPGLPGKHLHLLSHLSSPRLSLKIFTKVFSCVRVHAMCVDACGGQQRASSPLVMDLQALVCFPKRVLGTELGSPETAVRCLRTTLRSHESYLSSFQIRYPP